MGRKPNEKPKAAVQAMDAVAQRVEEKKLSIKEVEEQFGDGQPYERFRLVNEVKFYQQQMGESLIETGRRLIRIKAHEDHGSFMQVLENLNMAYRSAAYAMAAARKFGNVHTYAHLGDSKIRALTVLDDDSIQTLEDGGKAAGVTMDDVERMTVLELKAALRKEREKRKNEKTAQEGAISKKEEKINELEQQLRYQDPPTKEQLAAVTLEPLKKKLFEHVLMVQYYLDEAVKVVVLAQRVEGATFPQLQEWGRAHYEQLAPIGDLFEELDQALNNCGPDRPDSNGM